MSGEPSDGEGFRFKASGTPFEIGRQLVQQHVHAAMPEICKVITHPGQQAQVALGVLVESLGVLVCHTSAASAAATLRELATGIEQMPAHVVAAATGRAGGAH